MGTGLFCATKCEKIRTWWQLFLLFAATTSSAQNLEIGRIDDAPQIAEFALASDAPRGMTKIGEFIQREPYDGEPATQPTLVYVAYTTDSLFVVFKAFDDPALIRANLTSRENIGDDDAVSVTLDAFGDQRRAFVFETNALGVQRDLTFVEGQGFDETFDTVWVSRGQLTEWGFVVLLELPFRSLRFRPESDTPWRISFERVVQRGTQEVSNWPHISTQVDGRLNQTATVVPIRGVSPGRNTQIIPYTTALAFEGIDTSDVPHYTDKEFDAEIGIDFKQVWKDSVVADLTINPDFSQIESDQPQATVNQRFEVFFPERRPFFLENADFFNTPVNLLFTRRIADPGFGGRVTAKLGDWSLGTLIADDEAASSQLWGVDPNLGENALFSTLRVGRDIGEQSRAGALFVQRDFADSRNRVLGLDGRIKWNDRWVSSVQAVGSDTSGGDRAERSGNAAYFNLNRSGRHFNYFGRLSSISDDFDAQAGFIPRTGVVDMLHFASLFWWPEGGGKLVRWGPEFLVSQVWDQSGERLDEAVEVSLEWEFPGQTNLEINLNRSRERLTASDFSTLSANTDFDTDFVNVEYGTAVWKTFAISGDTSIGKRINFSPPPGQDPEPMDWVGSTLNLSYRPLSRLSTDTTFLFNRFDNESNGAKVIEDLIGRIRANWQFTRALSLRSIVQYERTLANPLETSLSERKNWNFDVLLTWRLNPWSAVYLGYNQNRQNLVIDELSGMPTLVRTDGIHKDSEQVILKISWLFRH